MNCKGNNGNSSDFQKTFTTKQTFKRNKRFIDNEKIHFNERFYSMKRRKPQLIKNDKTEVKMDINFKNSMKILNSNLNKDIQKFKIRLNNSLQIFHLPASSSAVVSQNTNIIQQQNIIIPRYKMKGGIPFEKLSARNTSYQNIQEVSDERLFNNFYLTQYNSKNIPDLQKQKYCKISSKNIENNNDLLYQNVSKQYEKNYFHQTALSCRFEYKKQNCNQGRYFYPYRKQQHNASTDLQPEDVKKSLQASSYFKSNKILSFYNISARDYPCQLQQKLLSPNKNYFKNQNGKLIKPIIDFMSNNMRQTERQQKKQFIKRKKIPQFKRGQICDERYFKYQVVKQSKI